MFYSHSNLSLATRTVLYLVVVEANCSHHNSNCMERTSALATPSEYFDTSIRNKINCIKYSIYVFTAKNSKGEGRPEIEREERCFANVAQKLFIISNAIKNGCSCNASGFHMEGGRWGKGL